MITEEDFVWWKETEALRARLKIAERDLLEMQTRNRELEKQIAGLMSGMNLPLYQGRIDFVESKLQTAMGALKVLSGPCGNFNNIQAIAEEALREIGE